MASVGEHSSGAVGIHFPDCLRAGDEDLARALGNTAVVLDHTPRVEDFRPQDLVLHHPLRPVEERPRPLRPSAEPGFPGGGDVATGAFVVVDGELRCPLQGCARRGEPAPRPGAVGRALELVGDARIGLERGGSPVPGAAIAVLVTVQRGRQGEVGLLPFGERGALVDGGADEGVAEVQLTIDGAHEAG